MATITATNVGSGFVSVTETTLDGTNDTFTFTSSKSPMLILRNDSGSTITPTIDGDSGTVVVCPGVGDVDVSGGISQAIANNEQFAVRLGTIREYLQGAIAITGGTGLKCVLIQSA